jgi:predicted porin
MKKTLLILVVPCIFACTARAQSNITIYGSFDAGVRHITNQDASGGDVVRMSSVGTYNTNRFGFRGVEDMGGGMDAHFVLESGFNSGTGEMDAANTLFNRTASVGLGGSWGSLDFGRHYTMGFRTAVAYDPMAIKYVALTGIVGNSVTAGMRFNNDIYYTGNFGPFTLRAEYALGEVTGSVKSGSAQALGASYTAGPLSFGGAYTKRSLATGPVTALYQDNNHWVAGAVFTTGPIRLAGGFADEHQDVIGIGDSKIRNAWFGGSYHFTSALALSAGYYRTNMTTSAGGTTVSGGTTATDGRRNFWILGATYAFSKRTNFYADVDSARYSGTGAIRGSATTPAATAAAGAGTAPFGHPRVNGISVGINHLF